MFKVCFYVDETADFVEKDNLVEATTGTCFLGLVATSWLSKAVHLIIFARIGHFV